jgi:RNA polymerase sigma factor (sigma-70 family)
VQSDTRFENPAGNEGPFPATRRSVVRAVADADPGVRRQAFEALVAGYWKPVYKYLRVKWRLAAADAEDVTQEFFVHALEKGTFAGYDPGRARFRTYLRTCLDRFAANQQKAAGRQKRGGAAVVLSLDFPGAEGELARQEIADQLGMEEYFHREWVRGLFAQAVEALSAEYRAAGKEVHFRLFERYDLEGAESEDSGRITRLTYAELAREHGLTTVQVTNWLAAARRDFRRQVLAALAELTGSEEELRAEARLVLGVEPR